MWGYIHFRCIVALSRKPCKKRTIVENDHPFIMGHITSQKLVMIYSNVLCCYSKIVERYMKLIELQMQLIWSITNSRYLCLIVIKIVDLYMAHSMVSTLKCHAFYPNKWVFNVNVKFHVLTFSTMYVSKTHRNV